MKKIKKFIIPIISSILVLCCLGTVTVFAYQQIYKTGTIKWYQNKIKVTDSEIGTSIKEITCTDSKCSIYDMNYQKTVNRKIQKLLKNDTYTLNNPLLIYNAYGTNTTSMNIYFTTDEAVTVSYQVHVLDESITDYENTLYNEGKNGYTKEHQYQLIGLVPGMDNIVTLTLKNANGEVVATREINVTMPNLESNIDTKLEVEEGTSTTVLSDGLYTVLGHDKNFNSNIYLYDNNGILRAELPLESYRSDRILWIDDEMVYAYNNHSLMFVNRLGQITKEYDLPGYKMHHDFIYDEANNSFLILANKKNTESIEDRIIRLDLETGALEELIDMRDYFTEAYESAKAVGGTNAYGGEEIDWIHLNSITLVDGDDIIVSARELSAIIRMNDIYTNPTLAYTIADESVFQDTEIASYNYTKVGEFVANAGQHAVTYLTDESLQSGQYYLYFYNNNYNGSSTRPDFNWEHYPGTGTYANGERSMYYQYLVDENAKTFTLVKEISLPYSSIVSSVQNVDNTIVTSSGQSHCFEEFDYDGNLITRYNYTAEKYAYRVFKYNYQTYWFQ